MSKLLNCYIAKSLNRFFNYGKETVAKGHKEVYSFGEGADSARFFGFERTRKINF